MRLHAGCAYKDSNPEKYLYKPDPDALTCRWKVIFGCDREEVTGGQK